MNAYDEKELEKKRLKKREITARAIGVVGSLLCIFVPLFGLFGIGTRSTSSFILEIIGVTIAVACGIIMYKAQKAIKALSKNSAKDGQ
jgi:protein-S-isoprenylcysteine O-methyltransferase Ste14